MLLLSIQLLGSGYLTILLPWMHPTFITTCYNLFSGISWIKTYFFPIGKILSTLPISLILLLSLPFHFPGLWEHRSFSARTSRPSSTLHIVQAPGLGPQPLVFYAKVQGALSFVISFSQSDKWRWQYFLPRKEFGPSKSILGNFKKHSTVLSVEL